MVELKVIDDEIHAALITKIKQCQCDLDVYVEMFDDYMKETGKFARWKKLDRAEGFIGGAEGLAMKVTLASCDEDGDGHITTDELERLDADSSSYLSEQNEAQLNAGIVAALILSFILPMTLEPIEVTDDFIDFFGQDAVLPFRIIASVVAMTSVATCLITLSLAIRFAVYINWISSNRGRTLFATSLDASLFPKLQMMTLNALVVAVTIRGTLVVGPLQGLFFILVAVVVQYVFLTTEWKHGKRAKEIQFDLVKMMLGRGKRR
jgi:hypothetical protein